MFVRMYAYSAAAIIWRSGVFRQPARARAEGNYASQMRSLAQLALSMPRAAPYDSMSYTVTHRDLLEAKRLADSADPPVQ